MPYDEIGDLVLKQGAIIDEKLFPEAKVSALWGGVTQHGFWSLLDI